jgi:hypothetical protein
LAALDINWDNSLEILDYVQRVLSINVFAGEKSIPDKIKSKFPIQKSNSKQENTLFETIDGILARHYGLSDEELDFIINYDVKYRMGVSAGEREDE